MENIYTFGKTTVYYKYNKNTTFGTNSKHMTIHDEIVALRADNNAQITTSSTAGSVTEIIQGTINDRAFGIMDEINSAIPAAVGLQSVLNAGFLATDASSGINYLELRQSASNASFEITPVNLGFIAPVSGVSIFDLHVDGSDGVDLSIYDGSGNRKVTIYNSGDITAYNDNNTKSVGFSANAAGAGNTVLQFVNTVAGHPKTAHFIADNITDNRVFMIPDHSGDLATNKQGINVSSGALTAASSLTVTYAPGYTPLNVIITPTDIYAGVALVSYWINNITNTQFVINFATPYTGTFHFNWQAF